MKFTTTLPTEPGFYAWKVNPIGQTSLAEVFTSAGQLVAERVGYEHQKPISFILGLWCRLVPADEKQNPAPANAGPGQI